MTSDRVLVVQLGKKFVNFQISIIMNDCTKNVKNMFLYIRTANHFEVKNFPLSYTVTVILSFLENIWNETPITYFGKKLIFSVQIEVQIFNAFFLLPARLAPPLQGTSCIFLNARSNNYGLLRVCTASRISSWPHATISRGNPSSLRLDFELLIRDIPASGFAL